MDLIAEAGEARLRDRNRYSTIPICARPSGLLDGAILAPPGAIRRQRRERSTAECSDERAAALPGDDATVEVAGTSHVSIIDGDG